MDSSSNNQGAGPRVVGFPARLAAYVVDVLVTWLVIGLVIGPPWLLMLVLGHDPARFAAVVPVVALLVVGAYFTLLHAHGRQTLGKLLVGAVVLDVDTLATIGPGRALGRLGAELLSALPLNLGYLWAAVDGERQALHDKLARTVVVRRTDVTPRAPTG